MKYVDGYYIGDLLISNYILWGEYRVVSSLINDCVMMTQSSLYTGTELLGFRRTGQGPLSHIYTEATDHLNPLVRLVSLYASVKEGESSIVTVG